MMSPGTREGRPGFGAKIRSLVIVALVSGGLLLADTEPAFAYLDPFLPSLLYQIGYFVIYGLLGILAFFKPIKRFFARNKEADPSEPDG